MMICRRWKEPIHLLVGGQLEEPSKQALLHHMEQCEKCRGYYHDLREIEAALRTPVPEKDFLARLEIRSIVESALVAAERKPIPVRRTNPFFHGPSIAWGFAATVLVFLCGYSFHELLEPEQPSQPQIASIPNPEAKKHTGQAVLTQAPVKTDSMLLSQPRVARAGSASLSRDELAADRHYMIASGLLKRHNFAGAAAALQKGLALHAAKRDKAMLDLAYCYSMLGQPQRAMPIYRAVARGSRDPKYVETAYNRIDSLVEHRLDAQATADARMTASVRGIPAGLWAQQGYYLVQMPIRREDSAKVDCLLEPFRPEIPRGTQAAGLSPQFVNASSPWVASDE